MLKPKFKKAVKAQILRAQECGQSEAVALAEWLDTLVDEPTMERDLVLSGLEEVEEWARSIRLKLEKA